ncbi:MAG: Unknown protein [uncultured Sulfurovum sp.]|uniref:Uncharacterized protein n=1 Tax=uncultured Sulfurovum sp. TaxID=269237 RepID=A0A6S6T3U8_9BACT|nr:MAG: Unknown protein [uncultured Sulfurovum sp.]
MHSKIIEIFDNDGMYVNHILPLSKGGKDEI